MSDISVSLEGVYNLLTNINIHKACGLDQIHGRILKEAADIISPFLITLFQNSLDSSVIPEDWHIANITPLFKQGNQQHPSNYQPLISIVSKLFEQIINIILQHLETNHILSDHQYDFCHSRLCWLHCYTWLCQCYDTGIHLILYLPIVQTGMVWHSGKCSKTGSPHSWVVEHSVLFLKVCSLPNVLSSQVSLRAQSLTQLCSLST